MSLIHGIALLAVVAAGASRSKVEFTKDSLEVVKDNVSKKKAVLVDVRTPLEWRQGNIEGSISLPIDSLKNMDAKALAKILPKDKILYTFCVVGMRAKSAAVILEKHGYSVRALKPGYDDLIKAGFKKGKSTTASQKAVENENSRQRNAG
jgi:phage shock protein E